MSQPAGIEGQQDNGGQQQTQQPPPQQNNAPYADYLNKIPEGLRPAVEPVFKEWDSSVTQRFQQIHQDYEPYKEIISEYEPQAIQEAINLGMLLENDPERVFNFLAESLGYEVGGGNTPDDDDDDENGGEGTAFDLSQHPEFQQLVEQQGTIAQLLQQQQEQRDLEKVEQEVLTELKQAQEDAKSKYGVEFDETLVLRLAATNGGDLNAAVGEYYSKLGKTAAELNQPGQNAPIVGGSNGSMPSQVTDPKSMTREQRIEAAKAVLKAANAQK